MRLGPACQYYVNSRREASDIKVHVKDKKEEQGGPGNSPDDPLNLLANLISAVTNSV